VNINTNIPAFSDLFLPESDPMSGYMFPGPTPIPQEMSEFIGSLMHTAINNKKVDFALQQNGVFFRGHRMPTISGFLYIFRRMPSKVWDVEQCGFPSHLVEYVSDERLSKGGLIIIAGMPGNGKSTSCAAIIVDRLNKFGGLCITVEDPPEMPLQGMHGNGLCFQREVENGEEFHVAVRDAMRGYPTKVDTMMLIGEVRDAETASLALRSSVDGRLVFVTTHAGNVIQAIQRILSLASEKLGEDSSRALLSSSLRLVAHQTIEQKQLKIETLYDTQSVAGIIRNKDVSLELLRNECTQQRNQLRVKLKIDLRNINS
jgi:Tfp pilus assembly protein, pilus retraction ATPase PilT